MTEKTAYVRNCTLNCLEAKAREPARWDSEQPAMAFSSADSHYLLLNAMQKYLVVTRCSHFLSEVKRFGLLLVLFLSHENLPMVKRWQ